MEIKESLKLNIQQALKSLNVDLELDQIIIENSKDPVHGDFASNVAMKSCRYFGKSPKEVADLIVSKLDLSSIEKVEIAGPGFINFFMKNDSLSALVNKIIVENDNYGRGEKKNQKINVEFVSANPTGDLHVGHARGAAIGDAISRILTFDGYDVTREYYINDAGNQIDHLGESLIERYKEILGLSFALPEDGYHGEDVKLVAKRIYDEFGPDLLSRSDYFEFFKEKGMEFELDKIKEDLKNYNIVFDVFSSEKKIRAGGAVEKEIEYLKDHIYEDGGALVLKTTDYLDDKDRVIRKSNGEYTYFMPDIVYHVNKMSRGFDQLIDVLGADHHGYINRMKSALMMQGYSKDTLEVELIQIVRLIKDGEEVRMSKRTGAGISLRELCEEVGVDAARYFFVARAGSAHLDFDLNLALERSSSNPVYYAQYAHARLSKVLESAKDIALDTKGVMLKEKQEIDLLKCINDFPKVVQNAALKRAPHMIATYTQELASAIHSFYTECRILDRDHLDVTASRLALAKASKIVMRNALDIIGVNAPDNM